MLRGILALNIREVSLFIIPCALFNTILIGWSIREYWDKRDYPLMILSIVMVIIVILIARLMYRVAFKINKKEIKNYSVK